MYGARSDSRAPGSLSHEEKTMSTWTKAQVDLLRNVPSKAGEQWAQGEQGQKDPGGMFVIRFNAPHGCLQCLLKKNKKSLDLFSE